MSDCNHKYDSYNGGLRCVLCDNRISESEYTEWLETQLTALRDLNREIQDINHQMVLKIAELEAESAGRMGRIKKLVALCYEHDIPMNDVLDTGLVEASDA